MIGQHALQVAAVHGIGPALDQRADGCRILGHWRIPSALVYALGRSGAFRLRPVT
jgi:hypothetical protein